VVLLIYTRMLLQNSENGNRIGALLSSRVQQICNKMWIKSAWAPYCAIFLSLNSTSQTFGRMDSVRLVIKCLRFHIPSRRQDNINYLFLLSVLQANSGTLYQMPSSSIALITLPFNASFKYLFLRSMNYKYTSTQNFVM